jgi:hypothetical protein
LSCCTGQTFGQFTAHDLASHGVPAFQLSADGGLSQYTGYQQWDYRFDPQFQSTIKPYLRWYMRYDPRQPGNRILPRDFGYGGNYGHGGHGAGCYGVDNGCGTCGPSYCSGYGSGYGSDHHRPSLYWNHLWYLRDVYGNTPITRELTRRPRTPGRFRTDDAEAPAPPHDDPDYDTDPVSARSARVSGSKNVWISRNEAFGTFSILFQSPPPSQSEKFTKAVATLGAGARIVSLEWTEKPDWDTQVQLVDGRLQPRI